MQSIDICVLKYVITTARRETIGNSAANYLLSVWDIYVHVKFRCGGESQYNGGSARICIVKLAAAQMWNFKKVSRKVEMFVGGIDWVKLFKFGISSVCVHYQIGESLRPRASAPSNLGAQWLPETMDYKIKFYFLFLCR